MPKIFFRSSMPIFLDTKEVIAQIKDIAIKLSNKTKQIEAIYLFGSYATGNAGFRSDADILIILSQDSRDMKDRLGEFILEFADAPVPVDVIVYTKDELNKALKQHSQFLMRAASGIRLI